MKGEAKGKNPAEPNSFLVPELKQNTTPGTKRSQGGGRGWLPLCVLCAMHMGITRISEVGLGNSFYKIKTNRK